MWEGGKEKEGQTDRGKRKEGGGREGESVGYMSR